MSTSRKLDLPAFEPNTVGGEDFRETDILPFALYSLASHSDYTLEKLAHDLEQDSIIETASGPIHVVRSAPTSSARQETLADAFKDQQNYARARKGETEYFPFGFLAICEEDIEANGVFVVSVDFEEPFEVTGFRVRAVDAGSVCEIIRNDDSWIIDVKDEYEIRS